ncbi:hypothetical protein KAR91_31715 [Candidatus Pacearchaeota archaeon]|nr:hypothetical protein [Candidatus Pacearchaeota archaeon]
MKKETFTEGMAIFSTCIKDFGINTDEAKVWYKLLQDISDQLFLKSVELICQTQIDIYPGTNIVALIREQSKQITGEGGALDVQATIALDKVQKAFWYAGVYKSVVFDDPIIHAVIENLGGWVTYCNTPDHELKWWKKDFEKKYIQYASIVDKLNPAKELVGLHAVDSSATEEAKQPVLIGDHQKILEWTGQKALTE